MSQTISSSPSSGNGAVPVSDQRSGLELIYMPILRELKQVESCLRAELESDTPFVDQLLQHSQLLGGKRIRPVLLLLAAKCTGNIHDGHINMAAALEMIHTATLVHDDVLDNASTRRHVETANQRWGTTQSVLLGDYLFTHSFHLASRAGSAEALGMLAQSSNRVCEGEMRQNAYQGNFELDETGYLKIISQKTAELCAVGCRLGAFLNEATAEQVEGFGRFGNDLGISFQIIDDILDIVGSPNSVGKTLGTDLINRKPTLPIIHSLANQNGSIRIEMLELLNNPGQNAAEEQQQLLGYLESTDSIQYARQRADHFLSSAREFANGLSTSEAAKSFSQLADFVLSRNH